MIIQRRTFLTGLAASLAAPAIVRAGSLMSVKAFQFSETVTITVPMAGMYHVYRVMNKSDESMIIVSADNIHTVTLPPGCDLVHRIGSVRVGHSA